MAITINRLTDVIYVPKADLTLIQSSPEIRELDLDWFRMQLKSIEDSEEGICFSDTHEHFTEVLLAGLTYARIVAILDPYTIEFEDGQYTINCVGANHNVSDVKIANQVSLIVNNAAGLITSAEIEYASFNGGVTIDAVNGVAGTLFPTGTPRQPVNNLTDAMLIAAGRGFGTIFIIGSLTIDSSGNYDNMIFVGESQTRSEITISSGASVIGCEIYDANISGTLDGDALLKNCLIEDLVYVYGIIEHCVLGAGTIALGGNNPAHFLDCWSGVAGVGTPVIDMGGSGQSLGIRGYSGGIKIINKSGSDSASIDLLAGQIIIDSTVTNGKIECRGVGHLTDNSTGTAIVSSHDLINREQIAIAVWDEVRLGSFTMEDMMTIMQRMLYNKVTKSGNIVTVYEEDEATPWKTFDLSGDGRVET